jgi:hypothetical protein
MNFEDFWGPCYLTGQDLGLRAEEALAGHQAIVGKIWNEDKGGIELEELERNQGIYDGYMRFWGFMMFMIIYDDDPKMILGEY